MNTRLPLLIGLFVAICLVGGAAYTGYHVSDNRGFSPEQPIPFSHKIHAGDNKIPCQYCHSAVDESRHSTIPSMDTCMNCHAVVKTDSPLIKEVQEKYKKGEAFEWVRIHDLPDFVRFNHSRHIKKGVDCTVCHGNVADSDKIKQNETLNMGFCVSCHRENSVSIDCQTCHY